MSTYFTNFPIGLYNFSKKSVLATPAVHAHRKNKKMIKSAFKTILLCTLLIALIVSLRLFFTTRFWLHWFI